MKKPGSFLPGPVEGQGNRKPAAFSGRALYANGTVQRLDMRFDDGET